MFKRQNANDTEGSSDPNGGQPVDGIVNRRGQLNGLAEAFSQLTSKLRRQYDINVGVLVIRRDSTHELAAISTWKNGVLRDGLLVRLPEESSLFEKVAQDGQVYTEEFCHSFSGNFFERKLLLTDSSRSFVVHPLRTDGRVVGLLGFSSEQPMAFAMFDEGDVDDLAEEFARVVHRQLYRH